MAQAARRAFSLLPAVAAAWTVTAAGGTFVRTELVSSVVAVDARQLVESDLSCLPSLALVSASVTLANTRGTTVVAQFPLDASGQPIVADGVYGAPSGVRIALQNTLDASDVATFEVLCGVPNPGFGGRTVAGTIHVPTRSPGRAINQCGPGYTATWGGYSASDLEFRGAAPHFGVPPYYFDEVPDGAHGGPVGWETYAYNPGVSAQPLFSVAVCWQLPDAVAQVGSVSLAPGERRFAGLAASDQQIILGGGLSGGSDGQWRGSARWTLGLGVNYTRAGLDQRRDGDGRVPSAARMAMTPKAGEVSARSGGVVGSFVQDLRPAGSTAPATPVKVAVVTVPSDTAPPATGTVQVVEYYNAARDHWFMTAIPQEMADLDGGVHPGWARTGQSFKAYGIGSGGPLGRLPFCRYYGLPAAGLDSHFYTGSILECLDIIAKFRGAWQLESGEVFQAQLPNVQTGACPAGTVAVFRTWNGRTDSNHRYMTERAIRTQMLAAGHVPEGYGPEGVAFCALA